MKLLKSGTWKRKITCRDCSAVMEILPEDVEQRSLPSEAHEFIDQYYITCPCCSKEAIIKLPENIIREVNEIKFNSGQ